MSRIPPIAAFLALTACGGDFAATDHTHEFAPVDHSHTDLASDDHTHTDLAADDHTHTDLAADDHTHPDLASSTHDHDTDYAAIAHEHDADYAPVVHDHDGEYVAAVEFNGSDNATCTDNAGALVVGNLQLEFGCHETCDAVCANHAMTCERAYTVTGTLRTCQAVNNNESLMCWCTG